MILSANSRENQKGPAGGAGPYEAETAKPPFPSNPKNPVRRHKQFQPPGERFGFTHSRIVPPEKASVNKFLWLDGE
jgi:hypothetical protein